MKKLIGVFIFCFLLNGCDDGDIVVETINFDNITALKCDTKEIVYKIKDDQILQINLTLEEYNRLFINEPGTREIPINNPNTVRYRFYNGAVSQDNICSDLQPATPTVISEWIGTSGKISVTTTVINTVPNPETGATNISRYNHQISFINIDFSKPDGVQNFDVYTFGDFPIQPAALPLTFNPGQLKLCASGTALYNVALTNNAAMLLTNLDPELLSTTPENLDVVKSRPLSTTSNYLRFVVLPNTILPADAENYFCNYTGVPAQDWIAQGGTVEVVSTTSGSNQYSHTIRLKGVTFTKNGSSFYYGNDIIYGTFLQQL